MEKFPESPGGPPCPGHSPLEPLTMAQLGGEKEEGRGMGVGAEGREGWGAGAAGITGLTQGPSKWRPLSTSQPLIVFFCLLPSDLWPCV